MALFGKKTTVCAICSAEIKTGLLKGLFQKKVEGQPVCNTCYGEVDLPVGAVDAMTLNQFKGYMAFRNENQKLKNRFHATEYVEFGLLSNKFAFDMSNGLFCLSKDLSTTIFEGKHIRSFTVREDNLTLFHGSAASTIRNESHVPQQIRTMAPTILRYRTQLLQYQNRLNNASESQKEQIQRDKPVANFREPFRKFHVEIQFDHPYWDCYKFDMDGPIFSSSYPDADDYLKKYYDQLGLLEQFANSLTALAFSGKVSTSAAAPASTDSIEDLKRFKELLDMGVITEAEFAAKKRQILGL